MCKLSFLFLLIAGECFAQSPLVLCYRNQQPGLCDTNGHIVYAPAKLRSTVFCADRRHPVPVARQVYWEHQISESLYARYPDPIWIDTTKGILLVHEKTTYTYIHLDGKPLFQNAGWQPYLDEPRILCDRIAVKYGAAVGFIDTQGKRIIPAKYISTGGFENGKAICFTRKNFIELMDVNGRVWSKWNVSKEKFNEATLYLEPENLRFSEGLVRISREEVYGFMDTNGQIAIPPFMEGELSPFQYGRSVSNNSGLSDTSVEYVLLDHSGSIIGRPHQGIIEIKGCACWSVYDTGRTSIIDSLGHELIGDNDSIHIDQVLPYGSLLVTHKTKGKLRIGLDGKTLDVFDKTVSAVRYDYINKLVQVQRDPKRLEYYFVSPGKPLQPGYSENLLRHASGFSPDNLWYFWRGKAISVE